jgi:hypothetical protein
MATNYTILPTAWQSTLTSEALTEGLTFEWLFGMRVAGFTPTAATPVITSTWVSAVQQLVSGWPGNKTFYVMADLTSSGFTVTPHQWQQFISLRRAIRQVPMCVVFILLPHSHLVRQMITTFAQLAGFDGADLQIEFFESRGEAMRWLKPRFPGDSLPLPRMRPNGK